MKLEKADFPTWRLRRIWSLEEGVQLLLGIEPIHNLPKNLPRTRQLSNKAKQELLAMLDIAIRSVDAGVLTPDRDAHLATWATRFFPGNFLKWAQSIDWDIPEELVQLLDVPEPEQQEAVEKTLDTRERKTLLRIIAVLAAQEKLDLGKHQAAAATLQAMGGAHGIELPKSQNTIANKLKEAHDLLKSQ